MYCVAIVMHYTAPPLSQLFPSVLHCTAVYTVAPLLCYCYCAFTILHCMLYYTARDTDPTTVTAFPPCVALLFSCLPLLLGRSNEHFSHVVANNLETCPRPAKKYPQTVIKLDRMSGRNKKKCRALVRKQSRPRERRCATPYTALCGVTCGASGDAAQRGKVQGVRFISGFLTFTLLFEGGL